jgi:hypothetical protein
LENQAFVPTRQYMAGCCGVFKANRPKRGGNDNSPLITGSREIRDRTVQRRQACSWDGSLKLQRTM